MKITDIKCHRLKETTLLPAIPRNLIEYTLVRVLTDEGIRRRLHHLVRSPLIPARRGGRSPAPDAPLPARGGPAAH